MITDTTKIQFYFARSLQIICILLTIALIVPSNVANSKSPKHKKEHSEHKKKKKKHGKHTGLVEMQALSFEPIVAGFNNSLITHPNGENAALFEATGEPHKEVTIYVVEDEIFMQNKATHRNKSKRISVGEFKTGGALNRKGKGVFDGSGYIRNIRIGATAKVKSTHTDGEYVGRARIRLMYR